MATEIIGTGNYPTDAKTGLTLPLTKFLGSQDLARQRAEVGFELEVIAKKVDRFGWDRDRGTPAHDRLMIDWMDALQDFPVDEVRNACRMAISETPSKTPNEGHIKAIILRERSKAVARQRMPQIQKRREHAE